MGITKYLSQKMKDCWKDIRVMYKNKNVDIKFSVQVRNNLHQVRNNLHQVRNNLHQVRNNLHQVRNNLHQVHSKSNDWKIK